MSQNHVIELPNTPRLRPVFCDYAGGRFRLTAEGLTFIGIDKDGNPLPPRWICAPLYVVAKTRDAQSGEWGRLLDGRMMTESLTNGQCPWLCYKAMRLM
ncbi:hypothetical protein Lbir_0520 [Legionella birminghamensis]|uniref:Inner membrane protein n=1 Tax=Legionella birminghamensis TaxID=28083 RepID=A0A378IM12_9GAMM|nr:hypothetical protein Lbir_0520 [Legionella birminghamensis]STX33144.1 inner membrane protein [Legionella birminghamensis]